MNSLNEKPIALANVLNNQEQPTTSPRGVKAFLCACLRDVENSYIKTLKDHGVIPITFADMVDGKPQLVAQEDGLNGKFNLCSHSTGFWGGLKEPVLVSDVSGDYVRLQGPCKKCDEQVFVIHENKPA